MPSKEFVFPEQNCNKKKIETILSNDKPNDSHDHQAPVITNIKIYHNFKKRFLPVNQNTIVGQLRIHRMR